MYGLYESKQLQSVVVFAIAMTSQVDMIRWVVIALLDPLDPFDPKFGLWGSSSIFADCWFWSVRPSSSARRHFGKIVKNRGHFGYRHFNATAGRVY